MLRVVPIVVFTRFLTPVPVALGAPDAPDGCEPVAAVTCANDPE